MDSQTGIQTRFARIKINKTIFSWTVFALQDKQLVILTVWQEDWHLEPEAYQNSHFPFLPFGKIKHYLIRVGFRTWLFENYEFLPFLLLWEHRHWRSTQNAVSSAWNNVHNQDWTLSHHQLWHTGGQTKICAGQRWTMPSPMVLQFGKALQCLLSAVPPKFEFKRLSSEGLQRMHGALPPHSWHNPTPDSLPGCAWYASMERVHFQRQPHEAKMAQEQSSTIMESLTRKKKSLVFYVVWSKNPSWVYRFVSAPVDGHLSPPISTQIYKSKEILSAQPGTEYTQKQDRAYSLSIQEETPTQPITGKAEKTLP